MKRVVVMILLAVVIFCLGAQTENRHGRVYRSQNHCEAQFKGDPQKIYWSEWVSENLDIQIDSVKGVIVIYSYPRTIYQITKKVGNDNFELVDVTGNHCYGELRYQLFGPIQMLIRCAGKVTLYSGLVLISDE